MTAQQQGDVNLFQTPDDGDISIVDGLFVMGGGLETAAYLSMFGGNETDDGSQDTDQQWWGNVLENNSSRMYRSETGHILQSIPATTSNMIKVKDAVNRDLTWFKTEKIASSVDVTIRLPRLNTVSITIKIEALGNESEFEFVENWKAAS